jgi:anti-sigma regulatory factor (Ser/Thr protein kinase)
LTKTERVAPKEHVVLFYESDEELARIAGAYLTEAVVAGSVAVVVASESHRAMLEREVASAGFDLHELRSSGSWITLDATETISRLVIDGRPDATAFESAVGELIAGITERGRSVCAYGEMVALLWDARQVNAAIELEELWNDLGERTPFSLFCSYASASLSGSLDAGDFEVVCSHHSAVVDPHTYRTGLRPVRRARRSFPATPESVTQARHFVTETALAWGFAQLMEDAQLVVSELGGNAIRHAHSEFTVVISESGASIRLAVSDLSHEVPRAQRPANDSSSGRGLMLVGALAAEWGVEQSHNGKVVWAELQR